MSNANEQWAVIGEDAAFSGRLAGKNLIVHGRIDGEIEISGRLRLGPRSVVKGIVRAAAVEVDGEFEGDIRATSLAFGETARARGVFQADRLSMREGALVNGALNLPPAPKADVPAEQPVAERAPTLGDAAPAEAVPVPTGDPNTAVEPSATTSSGASVTAA